MPATTVPGMRPYELMLPWKSGGEVNAWVRQLTVDQVADDLGRRWLAAVLGEFQDTFSYGKWPAYRWSLMIANPQFGPWWVVEHGLEFMTLNAEPRFGGFEVVASRELIPAMARDQQLARRALEVFCDPATLYGLRRRRSLVADSQWNRFAQALLPRIVAELDSAELDHPGPSRTAVHTGERTGGDVRANAWGVWDALMGTAHLQSGMASGHVTGLLSSPPARLWPELTHARLLSWGLEALELWQKVEAAPGAYSVSSVLRQAASTVYIDVDTNPVMVWFQQQCRQAGVTYDPALVALAVSSVGPSARVTEAFDVIVDVHAPRRALGQLVRVREAGCHGLVAGVAR